MNSIDGLLDTNILIDFMRGFPPAVAWMNANRNLRFVLHALVRMEMISGTKNGSEQASVEKLLSLFPILFPNEDDARWAMQQFEVVHLKSQIEIIDCLLAATSVRLNVAIYTRNVKHLRVVGANCIIPY
ncbi:MAG: PIN domain-containing protein [bacterium]|nr:PIN domain-containing protein [bacterium]